MTLAEVTRGWLVVLVVGSVVGACGGNTDGESRSARTSSTSLVQTVEQPSSSTSDTSVSTSAPSTTTSTTSATTTTVRTSNGAYPEDNGIRDPRVELHLAAGSLELRQQETTDVVLTVRNVSQEAVTFTFYQAGDGMNGGENQCRSPFGLFRDGQKVGGSDWVLCTASVGTATMAPGERVQYSGRLDTLGEDRRGALPPGRYDLFMGFAGSTSGHPPVWYDEPLAVTITP